MVEEYTPSKIKEVVRLAPNVYGFPIKVLTHFKIDMQGLAMSRSFGDNVSKTVGVTHVP
jgi:hypothetical protein